MFNEFAVKFSERSLKILLAETKYHIRKQVCVAYCVKFKVLSGTESCPSNKVYFGSFIALLARNPSRGNESHVEQHNW